MSRNRAPSALSNSFDYCGNKYNFRSAAEVMAMHIGAPVVATTRTSNKRDILLNAGANYVGLV